MFFLQKTCAIHPARLQRMHGLLYLLIRNLSSKHCRWKLLPRASLVTYHQGQKHNYSAFSHSCHRSNPIKTKISILLKYCQSKFVYVICLPLILNFLHLCLQSLLTSVLEKVHSLLTTDEEHIFLLHLMIHIINLLNVI